VEVIEALPRVLGNVDEPIAGVAQAELELHAGLRLSTGWTPCGTATAAAAASPRWDGAESRTDLVIIATGVGQPHC
jgi:hypothetical protein